MAAPITSVTGSFSMVAKWSASQTPSNSLSSAQGIISQDSVSKTSSYTTTGSTTANAINQVLVRTYSISASSSTTVDLSAAFTNVVGSSTATLARIKGFAVRLISTTDDSTNGTAASSILCGNSGANDWIIQSGSTGLGSATSTVNIANGAWLAFANDNATGTVIDGTHKNFKIANNDAGVAALVQIVALGADA